MVRTAVLVLNYNGEAFLPDCLASLGQLDVFAAAGVPANPQERDEVWLVDNGSQDGSLELVRSRFPWVRVLALEENLGFSAAYNRAAEAVEAEWLALLNNDTRVAPNWLSQLHACRQRHPEAAGVASTILSWDGSRIDFVGGDTFFFGQAWQRHSGEPTEAVQVEEKPLLFGCAGALLVHRQTFLRLGGFEPEYFSFFEDVDLGWRANLWGHAIWLCPQAVVFHRGHGSWGAGFPPRKRILLERNGLANVVKNWADERMGVFLLSACSLTFARGWWACLSPPVDRQPVLAADTLAHLAALAQLASWLPHLEAKRSQVQRGRTRRDEELVPLFGAWTQPPLSEGVELDWFFRGMLWRLGLAPQAPLPAWSEATNAQAKQAAEKLAQLWQKLLEETVSLAHLQERQDPGQRVPVPRALVRAGWRTWEALVNFWNLEPSPASCQMLTERLEGIAQAWEREKSVRLWSPPTVSVVVRTQNRPEGLRRALASIASQEVRPLEVLVVNDGGADPTPALGEWLRTLPVRLVHHPRPLGRSAAAQAGLAAAAGAFVNFLDDDDELRPNHLRVLVGAVENGAQVAYSDVEVVRWGKGANRAVLARGLFASPFDPVRLLFENYIPIMAVLFAKELALKVGGFDQQLTYFEDWDLWLRLAQHTPFVHCPEVTAIYHVQPSLAQGLATAGDHRWPHFAKVLAKHRPLLTPVAWSEYLRRYGEARALEAAALRMRVDELERTLAAIQASRGWRVLELLRRLRTRLLGGQGA